MWAKLDDGFYDHPKVLAAGNEAVGLFCRALTYCGRQLTEGFVSAEIASFLGGRKAAAALVEAGLWEEVDGGYQVHDFLDYNPRREQVEHERGKNRQRQRRWRESHSERNAVTDAVSNGCPDPTRPAPDPETGSPTPSPGGHAGACGSADEGQDSPGLDDRVNRVWSVLVGAVDSLSNNDHGRPWPQPKPEAIRDALAKHGPDPELAQRVAREVREIVQAQDRAPNVTGLFVKKLGEA